MTTKFHIAFAFFFLILGATYAQHDHHHHRDSTKKDTVKKHEHQMNHDSTSMGSMTYAYSVNLPMFRNGSGTAWAPDASPMYGYMIHAKKWMLMFHGNIFARFNYQDFTGKGSRGGYQFDAPNWFMFMGQRKFEKRHLFHFSTMFSLDAVFAQGRGYPLLFQSGEAYNGVAIVDRQHPHDLFSELSVSYAFAISKKMDVFAYFGYPGEPALGPVAFMHRPAALYNPDAPLSHHWIDATHITFGVGTLGFRYDNLKLEGSIFNGREPNSERFGFDAPQFNSWSIRLSYNPIKYLALQVSHGFLKSPEELEANIDVRKTTASAQFSMPIKQHWLNATTVWGMNSPIGGQPQHAFLFEGAWQFKRLGIHSRYEFVQKSTHDLSLDETIFPHDALFPINVLTIGLNYDVLRVVKTRLAVGGQFTTHFADRRLDQVYGKNPMSFEVYLRIYPELIKM